MSPPPKDKLLELAERCEAATGPDRELDAAVCAPDYRRLLGAPFVSLSPDARRVEFGTHHQGEDHIVYSREPLPVTASLDAAMTLVPEGWCFELGDWEGAWARVFVNGNTERCFAEAATPALALCAAALRSRSQTTEPGEG
jgi:hypothetical protein